MDYKTTLRLIDEHLRLLDHEDYYPAEVIEAAGRSALRTVVADLEDAQRIANTDGRAILPDDLQQLEGKDLLTEVMLAYAKNLRDPIKVEYRKKLLAERQAVIIMALRPVYAKWRAQQPTQPYEVFDFMLSHVDVREDFSRFAGLCDYTGKPVTISILDMQRLEELFEALY